MHETLGFITQLVISGLRVPFTVQTTCPLKMIFLPSCGPYEFAGLPKAIRQEGKIIGDSWIYKITDASRFLG